MGAQSGSVNAKLREAMREAAAREGVSVAEFAEALQAGDAPEGADEPPPPRTTTRVRAAARPSRPVEDFDDWLLTAPADLTRGGDPARLGQRLDTVERRSQLAITSLDRSVGTLDRTVLGLADRVEDAEEIARESAERIAGALDQFRAAGEVLSGRLTQAEGEARESRQTLESAAREMREARDDITAHAETAAAHARRAEEAVLQVSRDLIEERTGLSRRIDAVGERASEAASEAVSLAQAAAAQAVRDSSASTAWAVEELRTAREALNRRVEDGEAHLRDYVTTAVKDVRAANETLAERVARGEAAFRRAYDTLGERVAAVGAEARQGAENALHEVQSLQETITRRIERFEQSSREATAGLRQAAGAAIADLRNAQLGVAARLKLVEETGGGIDLTEFRHVQNELARRIEVLDAAHAAQEARIAARLAQLETARALDADLSERVAQLEQGVRVGDDIAERLAHLDEASALNAQLAARVEQLELTQGELAEFRARAADRQRALDGQSTELARRLAALEAAQSRLSTREDVEAALASFESKLHDVTQRAQGGDPAVAHKLAQVGQRMEAQEAAGIQHDGRVRTLEDALDRLAQRLQETENTANTALRTLEDTVSGLSARVSEAAQIETESLRAMLEGRLNEMAQSVATMVEDARTEIAGATGGSAAAETQAIALGAALNDVNSRLAAAERRQAQTIEAISIEIKRMSETVDRRLRAVETRGSGSGESATAVREELAHLAHTLETRFEEIERREAAGFDRMGVEIGRISERIEERTAAVEARSAQAIEQVGEQVARMAERFNNRQEQLTRDLGERVLDSEERSKARISKAISGLMQRLAEVETQSVEAVTPVARAMTTVATRLQALEDGGASAPEPAMPTPARRADDPLPATLFGEPDTLEQPTAAAAPEEEDDDDLDFYDLVDQEPIADVVDVPAAAEPPPKPVRAGPLGPRPHADRVETKAAAPPPWEAEADADLLGDDEWSFTDAEPVSATAKAAPPAADTALFGDESDLRDAGAVARPSTETREGDYLRQARRAAQMAAQPRNGRRNAALVELGGLRGSSRVVLWGAAGAIAFLAAGGAIVALNQGPDAKVARQHTPAEGAPAPAIESEAQANPFAVPSEAPPVPEHEGVSAAEHGGEGGASPVAEPDSAPPTGRPAPGQRPAGAASQAAYVAGPLRQRSGSVTLEGAAARGDALAQYELGLQRLSAGRRDEAISLLRQAANQGAAIAQYRLAKLYERGEGVPADLALARSWTERAAAAGNRRAMHDLGVYFARGEGAPLDEQAAFRWFRQAAELGVADSQYNLGILYEQGRGVNPSLPESLFWFLVAARQGDAYAGDRATALESRLQPAQIDQARARAEAFRPRAASAVANGEFGPRPWAQPAPARSRAPT
jgi:localization factor PodJL